eukprot:658354-Prymnesium_polylepis.6
MSVTQNPRVGAETDQFSKALSMMPHIYLKADAVLHVDLPWETCERHGETIEVDAAALAGGEMRQLIGMVQVVSVTDSSCGVAPNDIILSANGKRVTTVDDVDEGVAAGGIVVRGHDSNCAATKHSPSTGTSPFTIVESVDLAVWPGEQDTMRRAWMGVSRAVLFHDQDSHGPS